ncbi:hypothetical protein AUG19_02485 [archaeon 13_1_20CM_2_54_9]|nr:MAG: hypothetical protein AUJ07_10585 [Crenarchaeota archaeon 13_1_40CM_3_53_5]OLE76634.1 MAG: hypothetical protein AUG19_02485 [archaeon 13_1_20CM_2_54_9]
MKTAILLGAGLFLVPAGLLLIYDSGFLLYPTGYVVCNTRCYYYEYVYPIKRAEYWIGLFVSIVGVVPLGIGVYLNSIKVKTTITQNLTL